MDIGLVVSNDVMHMREPIPDFKMVRWAEEVETDGQNGVRLMPGGGTENIGDRTIHWYSTWEYPGRGGVRVATWQRDRLGYFSAVPRQLFAGPDVMNVDVDPHLISAAFTLGGAGRKMYVNAELLSQHSFLVVELLDHQFRPLEGYSGNHGGRVSASSLRAPLVWKSGAGVEAFDHPVRLRVNWGGVRPEDARLYAIYIV
jgi:hypothetical protein